MEASDEPSYEFLRACADGCPERITAAVRAGCDITARDSTSQTGLMLAAGADTVTSAAAVKTVLALEAAGCAKARLEERDHCGGTAYLHACFTGSVDCIAALAEAGCDTAARNSIGHTGLMLAAASDSDSPAAVQTVLALDAGGLEDEDDRGCTAFLFACGAGNIDCIAALAEAGCDTAARNSIGQTGLMLAAASDSDSAAAVQTVLALGAGGLEDEDDSGRTAFLFACGAGNIDCIAALAEAGCDKAARNSIGETGLMLAAASDSDSAAAVQTVLALDAGGLEDEDDSGRTAYLFACGAGNIDCIAALAEAGCDKAARNSKGHTGLMLAAASDSDSAAAVQTVLALDAGGLEDKDDSGCTAFLLACFKGRVKCIAALVDAGCDKEVRSVEGHTGLTCAAASDSAAAVQTVLALGAVGLEDKDDSGCTAFLLACFNGSVECIAALVEAGCDTAVKNSKGETGLMLAAVSPSDSAAAVQTVLALGAVGLEDEDDSGGTAFLLACFTGRVECIAALAEAGCDKAARNNIGRTGLMLAAASDSDSAAAVQTVLALDAGGLEDKDDSGCTAFLLACFKGRVKCIAALVDAGCDKEVRSVEGHTGLTCAAASDSAAAVQTVLAFGAVGLEDTDINGFTAFLLACFTGSVECIAALAEAGCDKAARNSKGHTGLMLAAASPSDSAAAVQTVLALGAGGLEDTDNYGYTAFLLACFTGRVECIAALAEAGCGKAARNNIGRTGLMLAAASDSDSAAAVQTVLALGAGGLEDTDDSGRTAFLFACGAGNIDCIAALAEAGCDKAARNSKAETGLMLAAASATDSPAAVQAMLALDAVGLEDTDDSGRTAFFFACGAGNIECIMVLANAGCDTFVRSGRPPVNAEGFAQCSGHEEVLPSIAGAHLIQRAREAIELAADASLAGYDRAIAHLELAIKQHGVSLEAAELLEELLEELWEQRNQHHELAVRKAQQAEAELMAMIEGEPSVAAADAKAAEKARRKKEKRQRQKMARAPAVTAASAAAAAQNSTPPEPPPAELLANTDAEKARKKKAKRLRQQERKAAAKRAAERSVASCTQTHLPTPPMLAPAQETVPMPEKSALERPALVELNQQPEVAQQPRELSPATAEPALPSLAQLTVEQSVAWLGTVSGLAPDAIEAAGRSFIANEIDGEDLKTMRPTFLRVILQGCLPEAEVRDAVIAAILGQRDEQLVEESTPEDCMVCPLSLCLMEDPWTTQVGSTCE
eukprot:COSAG01_NODE_2003_length_8671_cov_9.134858_2_plen_1234_part_00